ncbi:histidine phosphatase family protein [Vibrio sp. S11_S32]|uniref:histidine phosphatase family protein n=1 Tax=Vibrio sp. S11_S32 TaxID=2720225 RepID=UPI0016803592|nr:histidine phosphatase family protein [Vibrio sp. S11_S32]MBD1575747.1 histidine phosphatase family protein [Vibrio sp. S11_S32]
MTTLYFMRHAQSEANLADILASQINFPLTQTGKDDAKQIAQEFCQDHKIDKVITSSLLRAQQTGHPFESELDLTAQSDARLVEQDLGKYAGKTYADLDDEPDYCHDRALRWKWVPEGGGESYEMIAARLQPFFDDMFSTEQGNVLIITHAVTMRMIKAILTNILPEYPREIAHNGEIWQVTLDKQGSVHEVISLFYGDSKSAISNE